MPADPINPIPAEFGEAGDRPIVPVQPIQEVDQTEAFKKEMERKSRSVNEKDMEDTRSQNQEEHQLIVIKPLIEEVFETMKSELGSILDAENPAATTKEAAPAQSLSKTPQTTVVVSSSSNTAGDLSQGDDNLASKLAAPPLSAGKEQPQVKHVAKEMAPPPLTTSITDGKALPVAEKKQATSVQMSSSSNQGDTSSKQKEPGAALPSQTKVQGQPQTPVAKEAKIAPTQAPKAAQTQAPSQAASPSKPVATTQSQAPRVETPKPTAPQVAPTTSLSETKATPLPSIEPSQASSSLDGAAQIILGEPSIPLSEKVDLFPADIAEKTTPFEVAFVASKKSEDVIKTGREELEQGEGLSPVQAPPKTDLGDGKDQGRSGKDEMAAASQNLLSAIFPIDSPTTAFQEALGFDRLPPHILDLFDRIVGVITVLQVQGKTETTLHLNEQQSPLLQGAEIVITHVSTAPGSYNIELRGPPQATKIFQDNLEQLKKSFQRREEENKTGKKEFNFKINDITISLKDDRT